MRSSAPLACPVLKPGGREAYVVRLVEHEAGTMVELQVGRAGRDGMAGVALRSLAFRPEVFGAVVKMLIEAAPVVAEAKR